VNIKFACPHCGKQLTAGESLAGRQLACPNCRSAVTVPSSNGVSGAPSKASKKEHPLLLLTPVKSHPEDLIDMTAMVDIVFFLLIFFLVTSLQAVESVINLPEPEPSEGASQSISTAANLLDNPEYIVVTIDRDDVVWLEGNDTSSAQELRRQLRDLRESGAKPEGMLVLSAPEAKSETFVMVLDAGADAGITDISFSVEQSEEETEAGQ
jgi:biopolymer transport protein ExbD